MSQFGDILLDKCLYFSVRIFNLCHYLNEEKHEYRIADQIFRSASSIGANLSEAQCAISRNDFISKVYISLKETSETLYWLRLLDKTRLLDKRLYESLFSDRLELKKLLTTITKSFYNKEGKEPKSNNS